MTPVIAGYWAAAATELARFEEARRVVPAGAARRAARAVPRARGDAAPDRRARGRRASTAGPVADAICEATPLTLDDLAAPHADWVEPLRRHYRGVDVCEIPPNGQGVAALQALGILDGLDHTGGSRARSRAPAGRGHEARLRRRGALRPRRPRCPRATWTTTTSAARRALIDPARAGAPAAGPLQRGRHGLPVRGRRAAQRLLADPERLLRLRLARRRARHRRRAAEPRRLLHARARPPQPAGARQAARTTRSSRACCCATARCSGRSA